MSRHGTCRAQTKVCSQPAESEVAQYAAFLSRGMRRLPMAAAGGDVVDAAHLALGRAGTPHGGELASCFVGDLSPGLVLDHRRTANLPPGQGREAVGKGHIEAGDAGIV